jgi:hypothetical protein
VVPETFAVRDDINTDDDAIVVLVESLLINMRDFCVESLVDWTKTGDCAEADEEGGIIEEPVSVDGA